MTRPELATQLVSREEFDYRTAFSPAVAESSKILFEGRGGLSRAGPFKQFAKRFEGARFILASNRVPTDESTDKSFSSEIWGPMLTRTTFVNLPQAMPEKKTEHYSVRDLAHALLYLKDN